MKFFNEDSFNIAKKEIRTAPAGFKYGYIPNVFKEDAYIELVNNFPDVSKFKLVDKLSGGGLKRFYVGSVYYSESDKGCWCQFDSVPEIWKELIREIDSDEFKDLLRETTGVSFNSMTNFGFTYGNEGCVQEAHIDGEIRDPKTAKLPAIACLLYFNSNPDVIGGTCVYEPDRETVLFQAPHLKNGFFFFEQHPSAWHGFPVMPKGSERRLVSLAYNTENAPILINNSFFHKLICVRRYKNKVKKILDRIIK